MRAELVFMNKRIDMSRQARRRAVIVAIYAAFAALIAVLWAFTDFHGTGVWIIWAILLACRLFFGGYYRGGLIKPFNDRTPVDRPPRSPLLLGLRIYEPLPAELAVRNDERELLQRDRAHYLAYQVVGIAVVMFGFIASIRIAEPRLQAWMAIQPDRLYYALTLIAMTLYLTLPQAILLWTEPDMEPETLAEPIQI